MIKDVITMRKANLWWILKRIRVGLFLILVFKAVSEAADGFDRIAHFT